MWIVDIDFETAKSYWRPEEMWGMDINQPTHDPSLNTLPHFYGLDYNGRLVGVGSYYDCGDGELCIRGVCVLSEYRGLGFGKRLIVHAIEENLDKNFKSAWAQTKSSTSHAFVRAGFTVVAAIDKFHVVCRYNWKT